MPVRLAALIFIIWGLMLMVAGCGKSAPGGRASLPDKSAVSDSLVIELNGEDGRSVFEITRTRHKVDFMESASGVFVTGIDSLNSGYYYGWIYSVNDSVGQIASDRFITRSGDRIKWHFRKF